MKMLRPSNEVKQTAANHSVSKAPRLQIHCKASNKIRTQNRGHLRFMAGNGPEGVFYYAMEFPPDGIDSAKPRRKNTALA